MSELELMVWRLDPAFSSVSDGMLQQPADWDYTTRPGDSPQGNDAHMISGPPVELSPWLATVTLLDNDNDGLISAAQGDGFILDGQAYDIVNIYRGDFVKIDGQEYKVVTLYGATAEGGYGAFSFPLDADGKPLKAFDGQLQHTIWSMDSEPYPIPVTALPCFLPGARIATPLGPVVVEDLRAGDLVLTLDHGPQELLAVIDRRLERLWRHLPQTLRPCCVPAGYLGAEADLWLSPQHRLLLRNPQGAEALISARRLVGQGIVQGLPPGPPVIRYLHLLLPQHGIVTANGVRVESFLPEPGALRRLAPPLRDWFASLCAAPQQPARPILESPAQLRRFSLEYSAKRPDFA